MSSYLDINNDITLDFSYNYYMVDASNNNIVITLPDSSEGQPINIVRIDRSANQVLINSNDKFLNYDSPDSLGTVYLNRYIDIVYHNERWLISFKY